MKLRPAILLVLGIILVLFTACWLQAVFLLLLFSLLLLGVGCSYFLYRCRSWRRVLLPVLIGAALGLLSWEIHEQFFYRPAARYDGESGVLTCTMTEYPAIYEEYASLVVRGETWDGEAFPSCKLRLYLKSVPAELAPGDQLTLTVSLELPESRWNYDRFRSDRARGIYLLAEIVEETEITWARVESLREFPLRAAAACTRRIGELFPAEEAGVLNALIFGDERGLTEDYVTALRRTGLSHLTAVSGMNVSFLVGLLLLLFRRKWGTILSIPAVLFFVLMTGGSASILRAGIMQLLWLTASLIHREADTKNSLFLACGLILLGNPYAVADVGLWLSFAATLGLLLLGIPMHRGIMQRIPVKNRLLRRGIDVLAGTLAATIAAQVFVIPIQIAVFRELSLIAPLSNLLIVPLTEYAFTGGVTALLLSWVWMPLGRLAAVIPGLLVKLPLHLVPRLAMLPLSYISADQIYLRLFLFAAYPLLALALWRRSLRARAGVAAVLLLAVTVFFSLLEGRFTAQVSLVSTVSGQSVLLHHREETVVVNCGGSYAYAASAVFPEVERMSGQEVSLFILTDYRNSSAGNAEALLTDYRVEYLLLPDAYEEADLLRRDAILSAAEAKGTTVLTPDTLTGRYLDRIDVLIMEQTEEGSDRGYLMPVLSAGGYSVLTLGHLMPETVGYFLAHLPLETLDCIAAGDHYTARALPPAVYGFSPEICV
ncbi:MAG: DUF4131 domain-containing protein, partial [Ruminococcaceae bacterium]|nr:DUF4131 domain-containing protein [Oscillospiraceae bacterium]